MNDGKGHWYGDGGRSSISKYIFFLSRLKIKRNIINIPLKCMVYYLLFYIFWFLWHSIFRKGWCQLSVF